VAVTWEFSNNDYFEDAKLEKKFWYRRSLDGGWSGLVSEPVKIKWKKGKDLTGGLLDMVCNAWEAEKKEENASGEKKKELTKEQKVLKKKIESTGMGGMSFFAWFGFIGRRISAEESKEANAKEEKRREQRKKGEKVEEAEEEDEEVDEDEEDLSMSLEIFPDGDDLAIAITEDLWPGAIKYFSMRFAFLSLVIPIYLCSCTNIFLSFQHKHKNKTLSQTPTSSPTTKKKTTTNYKAAEVMGSGLLRNSDRRSCSQAVYVDAGRTYKSWRRYLRIYSEKESSGRKNRMASFDSP
jgi:hypothetical protein